MSYEGDWDVIPKKVKIAEEQKYFTAQEAREVSNEIVSNKMNDELDWIYDLINEARFKGKYEITFSNTSLMKVSRHETHNLRLE